MPYEEICNKTEFLMENISIDRQTIYTLIIANLNDSYHLIISLKQLALALFKSVVFLWQLVQQTFTVKIVPKVK